MINTKWSIAVVHLVDALCILPLHILLPIRFNIYPSFSWIVSSSLPSFLSSSLSWPVPSVGLHSLLAHRYDSFLCRHHHLRDGIRQQTETCRQQAEEWLKQKARHRRRSVLPMAQAVPVIILKYRYTGEFITENKFRFYDLRGISCWSEVLICGKFQTL